MKRSSRAAMLTTSCKVPWVPLFLRVLLPPSSGLASQGRLRVAVALREPSACKGVQP